MSSSSSSAKSGSGPAQNVDRRRYFSLQWHEEKDKAGDNWIVSQSGLPADETKSSHASYNVETGVVTVQCANRSGEDRADDAPLAPDLVDRIRAIPGNRLEDFAREFFHEASRELDVLVRDKKQNGQHDKMGSCFNGMLILGRHHFNANAGDSCSYSMEKNHAQELVITKATTLIHNIRYLETEYKSRGLAQQKDVVSEDKLIKDEWEEINPSPSRWEEYAAAKRPFVLQPGPGQGSRLGGRLAVSHAIGDNEYNPKREFAIGYSVSAGLKLSLIVSDGVTDVLKPKDLENIIKDFLSKKSKQFEDLYTDKQLLLDLGISITAEAKRCGTMDDASIVLTMINPAKPKYIFQAMYDGHGGPQTADLLRAEFSRNMLPAIMRKLLPKFEAVQEVKDAKRGVMPPPSPQKATTDLKTTDAVLVNEGKTTQPVASTSSASSSAAPAPATQKASQSSTQQVLKVIPPKKTKTETGLALLEALYKEEKDITKRATMECFINAICDIDNLCRPYLAGDKVFASDSPARIEKVRQLQQQIDIFIEQYLKAQKLDLPGLFTAAISFAMYLPPEEEFRKAMMAKWEGHKEFATTENNGHMKTTQFQSIEERFMRDANHAMDFILSKKNTSPTAQTFAARLKNLRDKTTNYPDEKKGCSFEEAMLQKRQVLLEFYAAYAKSNDKGFNSRELDAHMFLAFKDVQSNLQALQSLAERATTSGPGPAFAPTPTRKK